MCLEEEFSNNLECIFGYHVTEKAW